MGGEWRDYWRQKRDRDCDFQFYCQCEQNEGLDREKEKERENRGKEGYLHKNQKCGRKAKKYKVHT